MIEMPNTSLSGDQNEEVGEESRSKDLEDTIEFTPEEAQTLKIYAEWVKHRQTLRST